MLELILGRLERHGILVVVWALCRDHGVVLLHAAMLVGLIHSVLVVLLCFHKGIRVSIARDAGQDADLEGKNKTITHPGIQREMALWRPACYIS